MVQDATLASFGRDPAKVAAAMRLLTPLMRRYFRAEVHGIANVPDGGALVVSNHSGGTLPMDVPVFATEFFDRFGVERPFYVLGHDFLFTGPLGGLLRASGFVPTSREAARALLRGGGVTMVFPGGDYDAARPFYLADTIDFAGRTGYVRTAVDARVPIVPVVQIGGQETQLFLSRGEWIAKLTRIDKLLRAKYIPISVGFPFGLSVMAPLNLPLPSKIVASVLPAVDPRDFDDDVAAIDKHVRAAMQVELQSMRRARRFPVLG